MKKLIQSNPIVSFIFLTFVISVPLDCSSIWFDIPKSIVYALNLIATISPLIAGLIMLFVTSDARIKIGSKKVFIVITLSSIALLIARLILLKNGMSSKNIPFIEDISILSFILLGIGVFLIGLNASQVYNNNLKENYIKTFLFNSKTTKWYLFAFFIGPILFTTSYLLGNLLDLQTSSVLFKAKWHWPISFLLVFLLTGAMEEFGWRGFLQKEMQKKYNPLVTALVLAVLWHLWHLPLFYNGYWATEGISHSIEKFLFTIPATIVINWLYNKSHYSILAVMILHTMYDVVQLAFGDSMLITFALMMLFSIYCIIDDKMWVNKSYQTELEIVRD